MLDFLKKNWINGLGIAMIFTAFIYFLELTTAELDIPIELKLAISASLGIGLIYLGIRQFHQSKLILSQVLSGIGSAIIFSTIGFVSFSKELSWSPESLMTTLGILVSVNTFLSDRYNLFILAIISTCGGLLTPLFIQATENYDIALFIYLLLLNLGAIFLSIKKDWTLIRYICFGFSLIIYAVYYHLFEPITWLKPFIYISIMFVIYSISFLVATWKKAKSFDGLDLYLSIINSINFIYWSHFIFGNYDGSYIIPLAIAGVLFLCISMLIYNSSKSMISAGALIYFLLGIISISTCGNELALHHHEGGLNYLITAFMWLFILGLTYAIIKLIGSTRIMIVIVLGFIVLTIYWFTNAWSVDWIPILGFKFIPFLNLGAIVWILLASFGFSLSKHFLKSSKVETSIKTNENNFIKLLSNICAFISHIVLGGLLTIQVLNLWEAYDINFLTRGLMVSFMWLIYAVLLFRWSFSSKQIFFKILGIIVIIITSVKVFLFDLSGESSVEKIIFLIVFSLVLFLLGKINLRHQEKIKSMIQTDENHTKIPEANYASQFYKKF